MAGGKGTRISSVASDIPKPMIKIDGKPVLEHQIECLKKQGFTDIILTVSHLGNIIIDYFGNGREVSPVTGESFGVNITYYFEKKPLGTAGALLKIKDWLKDDFLLLNADSIFDVDFNRFVKYHKEKGGLVTLFTHPNDHPYDSGIVIADKNKVVQNLITKEDKIDIYYRNRVNAGLHIISPEALNIDIHKEKVDLDIDILKQFAGTGKMYVYDSPEYVKDMGTPERYSMVCRDFKSGKVKSKNLINKQKAIFLDRDGTLNKYVGFLRDEKDFELIKDVSSAIKKINESGYLAIVITNQPVIARGEITIEELENIHNKMETLLGYEGAYLDAIYYCPHHEDSGFKGERIEYKIECNCRKPKSGMFFLAKEEYNIDLESSWMIGDKKSDIYAGKGAGCKTALIGNAEDFEQDVTVNSLFEFVTRYLHNDSEV